MKYLVKNIPSFAGTIVCFMKPISQITTCLLLSALFLCNIVDAQINVGEEPHHKVVFANEYARVLDLFVIPGDSTIMHVHAAQSAVIWMSNSVFEIRNAGEAAVMLKVKAGDVVFRAYGEKPATHVVSNFDTAIFHCMVVELIRSHPGKDTWPTLSAPGTTFQWQKDMVSAYKVTVLKDQRYSFPKSGCARFLIVVSGRIKTTSSGSAQTLQAGGFVFFPPQSKIEIEGKEDARYVLLELQ